MILRDMITDNTLDQVLDLNSTTHQYCLFFNGALFIGPSGIQMLLISDTSADLVFYITEVSFTSGCVRAKECRTPITISEDYESGNSVLDISSTSVNSASLLYSGPAVTGNADLLAIAGNFSDNNFDIYAGADVIAGSDVLRFYTSPGVYFGIYHTLDAGDKPAILLVSGNENEVTQRLALGTDSYISRTITGDNVSNWT